MHASEARRARDWATADRLKAELEAAGWKVIDAASLYTLERAAAPDVEVGGTVRYGSTASVPSRLDEAPVGVATVVIVATDDVAGAVRQAGGARRRGAGRDAAGHRGQRAGGWRTAAALEALDALDAADPARRASRPRWSGWRRASARPRPGTRGCGGRRRRSSCSWAPGVGAAGVLVPAIVAALEDETVAVAGPVGLVTDDLRSFRAAPPTPSTSTRSRATPSGSGARTAAARGLLDEHFVAPDHLDTWWSLVLRDPADDEDDGRPSRGGPSSVPVELARDRSRAGRRRRRRPRPRAPGEAQLLPVPQAVRDPPRPRRAPAPTATTDGVAGIARGCGKTPARRAITEAHAPRCQGRGLADSIVPPAVWHSEASFSARGPVAAPPPILRPCVAGSASWPSSSGSPATATCGRPGPRIPVPVERLLDPRRPDPALPEAAWWRTT